MSEVVAVYADGGCVASNPSSIAGTWASCWVDASGRRTVHFSGWILAGAYGLDAISNNQTEFFAVLRGLEHLPDGWSGQVCTDSLVTIRRWRDAARLNGIPHDWRVEMGATLRRLGPLTWILLDGHPTRAQLLAGIGKRGNPVSEHNVFVDRLCGEAGQQALRRQGLLR